MTEFEDEAQVLNWANDSQYGWPRPSGQRRRTRPSPQRTVAVWLHLVNTHFMLVSEMPHGGMKLSGYGKDMSVYGLEDYTVVRHVMFKH